jgi:hypothetical protein
MQLLFKTLAIHCEKRRARMRLDVEALVRQTDLPYQQCEAARAGGQLGTRHVAQRRFRRMMR